MLAPTKVIDRFWQTRPVNIPALGAMEKSFKDENDQVVYKKYIREMIMSVKGRQRTDL